MNAFPFLSLFAFLLLLLLLPILFGELMATSLVKLHLSPEAALLLMIAIIVGGLVNIPVKRIARERMGPAHPLAVFGLGGLGPGRGGDGPAPPARRFRSRRAVAGDAARAPRDDYRRQCRWLCRSDGPCALRTA